MTLEEIKEILVVFAWPFIVSILAPIISAEVYKRLKDRKTRYRWGGILMCSIVVGLIWIIFLIGKTGEPKIQLVKQPEKTDDTLIFNGQVLNYNPYRIITYLEKSSSPGKLYIIYPDITVTKWRIGSEGSWMVKIPPIRDIKIVYFFLVRERYPAPDHAFTPENITCVDWTKWGIAE